MTGLHSSSHLFLLNTFFVLFLAFLFFFFRESLHDIYSVGVHGKSGIFQDTPMGSWEAGNLVKHRAVRLDLAVLTLQDVSRSWIFLCRNIFYACTQDRKTERVLAINQWFRVSYLINRK